MSFDHTCPLCVTIDRIDRSDEYAVDNIMLVCKWTIAARGAYSISEFRNIIVETGRAAEDRLNYEFKNNLSDLPTNCANMNLESRIGGKIAAATYRRTATSTGSEIVVRTNHVAIEGVFLKAVFEWLIDRLWCHSLHIKMETGIIKLRCDKFGPPFCIIYYDAEPKIRIWSSLSGPKPFDLADPDVFKTVTESIMGIVAENMK